MDWDNFEGQLKEYPIYTINNNTNKNIVLFGNCHTSTVGFFLNDLLNKEYNVHIIISWYCYKVGLEHFNMENVNNRISFLTKNCDILLFHKHIKNYGVKAMDIPKNAPKNAIVLELPNFQLIFDSLNSAEYERSVEILDYNIQNSDFKDFYFIVENKTIQFFNVPDHPTHYILFLLTKCIYSRIKDETPIYCTIYHYYDETIRKEFKQLNNYVRLPGKIHITPEIAKITGIPVNPEYFD